MFGGVKMFKPPTAREIEISVGMHRPKQKANEMNNNTIPEDIAQEVAFLIGEWELRSLNARQGDVWKAIANAILAERQHSERTIRELEYQIKMAEFKE